MLYTTNAHDVQEADDMTDPKIGHNGGPAIEPYADPFMREGYVRVYRAMRDHPVVGFGRPVKPVDPDRGSFSRAEAWLDLIMECKYAPGSINNKGRVMVLEPGQLLGAVSWLAHRWNWTPKTVRGFLDQLHEQAMLERAVPAGKSADLVATEPGLNEIQTGNRKGKFAQVLTICNYSIYQIVEGMKGQVKGQDEGKSRASRGQDEGNNLRREEGKKIVSKIPPTPQGGIPSETPKSEKSGPTPTDALRAFEGYNATALRSGLQQASRLSPDRQRKIIARLREYGDDGWARAMVNLEASPFLRGRNKDGWRANLDFVLQATSFGKLHDGAYADKPSGSKSSQTSPSRSRSFDEEQELLLRIDAELNGGKS